MSEDNKAVIGEWLGHAPTGRRFERVGEAAPWRGPDHRRYGRHRGD
jgi:hypothetical protein